MNEWILKICVAFKAVLKAPYSLFLPLSIHTGKDPALLKFYISVIHKFVQSYCLKHKTSYTHRNP